MRKHLAIIVIVVASIAVHFLYFGYPRETVFDEVHFGKFISGYFTHEYFFDIHPPLGKLILSGAGYLAGFKPGFSFANIGEKFPDSTYLALRFLPTLAGTLLPLVIYFFILELGMSKIAAFIGGLLIALENALLVQSRFILLDSFMLLFGFAALLCYLYYRKKQKPWLIALAAVLAIFSASVKWTGLTFLAVIGIAEFITLIKHHSRERLYGFALLVIIPPVLYFSIFAIHLKLLYKSGPGDAFMTQAFKKTLIGSPEYSNLNIKPLSLFQKTIELNKEMYRSNARLKATHPYSSKWYQWPFMTRPIYYWNESSTGQSPGTMARIYLLGNPVLWWVSTFAILYAITSLSFLHDKKILLLLAFYAMNILPFTDISRAMFLYHYFVAYIVAIILLIYLIDRLKQKKRAFTALAVACVIAFIFFAPLSYGNQLSTNAYNFRAWFTSWR